MSVEHTLTEKKCPSNTSVVFECENYTQLTQQQQQQQQETSTDMKYKWNKQ